MNNFPRSISQIEIGETSAIEVIILSREEIDRAVQISHQIPAQLRQWQTYLNALALFGFQQWLEQRADELNVNLEQCSLLQPAANNAIEAVCNLKVGEFQLGLIATSCPVDDEVILPRAIVDLPEFIPHFYVLLEVEEEQGIVVINGFLPYNQLLSRWATVNLSAHEDWTYQIPLTWFESDLDQLLLYLRCLDESAIPLPAVRGDRLTVLSKMQQELATLLPQLRSPEGQLWQVLTWEQGVAVLTNPELLNWVYELQGQTAQTQHFASPQLHISDLLHLLTQPAINVGRWLWNELDEIARSLSWMVLPNLAPTAMRSPVEEFEAIAVQLQHKDGQEIPPQARGAYCEVHLAGIPLQLYAVTWLLPTAPDNETWTLLLVMAVPSEITLPCSLKFRVSDKTGVLAELLLNPEQGDRYLFTRVVGTWEDKFIIAISLANGIELTLPPFSFEPIDRDDFGF